METFDPTDPRRMDRHCDHQTMSIEDRAMDTIRWVLRDRSSRISDWLRGKANLGELTAAGSPVPPGLRSDRCRILGGGRQVRRAGPARAPPQRTQCRGARLPCRDAPSRSRGNQGYDYPYGDRGAIAKALDIAHASSRWSAHSPRSRCRHRPPKICTHMFSCRRWGFFEVRPYLYFDRNRSIGPV
jgi:hypothetical protein